MYGFTLLLSSPYPWFDGDILNGSFSLDILCNKHLWWISIFKRKCYVCYRNWRRRGRTELRQRTRERSSWRNWELKLRKLLKRSSAPNLTSLPRSSIKIVTLFLKWKFCWKVISFSFCGNTWANIFSPLYVILFSK